jgi:hypothetical protein
MKSTGVMLVVMGITIGVLATLVVGGRHGATPIARAQPEDAPAPKPLEPQKNKDGGQQPKDNGQPPKKDDTTTPKKDDSTTPKKDDTTPKKEDTTTTKKADLPPPVTITTIKKDKTEFAATGSVYNIGSREFTVTVSAVRTDPTVNPFHDKEASLTVYVNGAEATHFPLTDTSKTISADQDIPVKLDRDGLFTITASASIAGQEGARSQAKTVNVRTGGPRVIGVQPLDFASTPGQYALTVTFDADHKLSGATSIARANFELKTSKQGAQPIQPKQDGNLDSIANAITVNFDGLLPEVYTLTVKASGIVDIFGNNLQGLLGQPNSDYFTQVVNPIGGDLPSQTRGITGQTGPYVEFKEWLNPAAPTNGFNPSDHVETRVVRLYYFRDAHRVAQIVNREAKSYNFAAVEVRRRLADKARDVANNLTDERRAKERRAVQAEQDTRQAEHELQQAQQEAQNAQSRKDVADAKVGQINTQLGPTAPSSTTLTPAERTALQSQLPDAQTRATDAANDANKAAQHVADLQAKVQALRQAEVAANEEALVKTAQEDRAREEQFRQEVAAAHEDPDTYAPGKPDSDDPVRRCSVSVIGEGEIQLRGPIKGLNIIRTMINQIDAPVGQVRVTIHTAQINGEHGDRMEKVANRIQKYIDHSRFLTSQSAQMLRKAVFMVASRKAEQASASCAPGSQISRDEKYLYAFFGEDFIRELETLDSEFLHTGNKLLSLHSMDTTSLASALFLLALAKNSTRREILDVFERMITDELPAAEMRYFEEAGPDKDCKQIPLMAYNSRFQSLRGFFDADVSGDDTMTPIQREFIKLAQIFKSRLVTELEYNQRVTERSVIEERFIGNYEQEVKRALAQELAARQALIDAQHSFEDQRTRVIVSFDKIHQLAHTVVTEMRNISNESSSINVNLTQDLPKKLSAFLRHKAPDSPGPTQADLDKIIAETIQELRKPGGVDYSITQKLWDAYKQGPVKEVRFSVKVNQWDIGMKLSGPKITMATPDDAKRCEEQITELVRKAESFRDKFKSFDFSHEEKGLAWINLTEALIKRVQNSKPGTSWMIYFASSSSTKFTTIFPTRSLSLDSSWSEASASFWPT